ncbi:MAG: lamin tail domain-containing protein [Sedimentisphaerales bacterium]|nr:lamin tail domain-containing protein [Sedimentisphaerales bacterium]
MRLPWFAALCTMFLTISPAPEVRANDGQTQGGTLLISEFMASNGSRLPLGPGDLLDADGDSSDWIEIYNPTDEDVDVGGWYLTDDHRDLTRWRFPDGVTMKAGEFLVVFASGKDHGGAELHTNFRLDADGSYLALVYSDGATVVHEYAPRYPRQLTDVSYGLRQYARTLVPAGAKVSYHVPTAADAGANWTSIGFNDSAWDVGPTGLGFGFGGVARKAYNDCVYRNTDQYIADSVTTYSIGNGYSGPTSGLLVDQATGEEMGVTVTLTESGGVNWQPEPSAAGSDCAVGTDAYNTFSGIADMTGVIYYGSAGWWVDVMFTGLDPATEYTFATSSARNSYSDRLTIYTLSGADTYVNASTEGVDVLADNQVRFNSGDNHNQGYVARWTGITAADGTFSVRAEADPSSPSGRAYAFDVFMLEGGFSGANIHEKMENVNASLWVRAEFEFTDSLDLFDTLTLRMKFDDGFVAYLNGVEVARSNVTGTPGFNAHADGDRSDDLARGFATFDISSHLDLLRQGVNVLAVHALNDSADDATFLVLPELVIATSTGVHQYFTEATPGRFNVSGALDVVGEADISHDRGFYSMPFDVTISTQTPGASVRFTTDGSVPSATHGQEYAGPIHVDRTMCLRAVALKPGWVSSSVNTQTYLFLDQVIRQSGSPTGFPTSWGGTNADYQMDTRVTNDSRYRGQMKAALLSIPTLSIVTDVDGLFGAQGIYSNPGNVGPAWERPVCAEWINPDGTTGFAVDAGLRIQGGAFRGFNLSMKKSFRLVFKRDYGPTKLEFAMFDDPQATTSFDAIVLRAGANDAWNFWGNANTQYIVDEFVRRTQLALGQPSAHGTFVHLYLNGLYWGLYNATERPDGAFCATYFGGEKEQWDALNSGEPKGESNTTIWNAMLNQARAGLSDIAAYEKIQGNNLDGTDNPLYDDLLDVENYVDYMFSNFWGGTGDWPWHNWFVGCRRPPDATGFKFFNWDSEGAITVWSNLNANVTGASDGAAIPHVALKQNPEYLLLFGDHAHRFLFNNGPGTVNPSHARYKKLADQVELAIIAESARWGDMARSTPYTQADWRTMRDYILNTYMKQRSAVVLQQLQAAGLYPDVGAPSFVVNGTPGYTGPVPSGSLLTMTTAGGQIYYTLDGSDPRIPIPKSAPGQSVTLVAENAPKRVFVPTVANGGDRLGTTPAEFQVTFYKATGTVSSLSAAESVISTPANRSTVVTATAPVINFFNTGDQAHFTPDSPFPGTTSGSDVDNYVILVTASLIIPTAGSWSFGVNSDDGFGMTLTRGSQVFSMSYPDPRSPGDTISTFNVTQPGAYNLRLVFYEQGGGSGLEFFVAKGAFGAFDVSKFHLVGDLAGGVQVGEGNVWFTSYLNDATWASGTGGVGYDTGAGYVGLIGTNVQADMLGKNSTCYIRIPFTSANVEYSRVMLRMRYDDGFIAYLNGMEVARRNLDGDPKWNSAASAERADSAAVTFEEIDVSNYANALGYGANLLAIQGLNASAGDEDFLISCELVASEQSQGDVAPMAVRYTAPIRLTRSAVVKARMLAGKWSAVNEVAFAVGPVAQNLRVGEIMYHPVDNGDANDPNTEYIELTNIGAESINLNLVRFAKGIDCTFPSVDLAPGRYVLVVKNIRAFEAKYGTGLPVAGQYVGTLSNAGERIELCDAAGRVFQSFEYRDNWYDLTDGLGFSLTVRDPVHAEPNALSDKDLWRPSANAGGSPGAGDAGQVPEPGAVVINEVMAYPPTGGADWIELCNTTDQAIAIGGWFLSDDADNLAKYEIAAGTVIDAGGYLVFDEGRHFGSNGAAGAYEPFGLSRNGETVYLHSGSGGVVTGYSEQAKYGVCEQGVSFGRHLKSTGGSDFVAMSEPTMGQENAEPLVGPIVINEIMYHPALPTDVEYVELLNVSDAAVTLYDPAVEEDWRFTDDPDDPAIDFLFPTTEPVTLDPGQYLLLVRDLTLFNLKCSVPAGVQIFAWGAGRLSDDGAKIQLSRPGDVDADGVRRWIRVDRVSYSDGAHAADFLLGVDPWPAMADGKGASLNRIVTHEYGNDPANWRAVAPTPGTANQ